MPTIDPARTFHRASIAMQAYAGALGELREEMQESPFGSWNAEQIQVTCYMLLVKTLSDSAPRS